jgi:hypothetical protein
MRAGWILGAKRASYVLRLALFVPFSCVLGVAPAGAQPAPIPAATAPAPSPAPVPDEAARKAEAKERFLRGLELANRDVWDAALVEFEASIELYPTRVALRNAAVSRRNIGRYAEALETYLELGQKFGADLPADEKKKIDDAIAELRAYVGEISVSCDQPGAVVVIDGRQYGTTPLAGPLTVSSGTHLLRVSKEGYEPSETQVAVAGKQQKGVSVKLRVLQKSGTLSLTEAGGKSLEVVLDGAVVGKTPWRGVLPVGKHSVLLRGQGDEGSPPGSVVVREGETVSLSLFATQLDAELRVEPLPVSAAVDVDGQNVGAGVWQGKLASGPHRVEVYAEGHLPFQKEVTLTSHGRETVKAKLERDLSSPLWHAGFRPHLYAELALGLAFGLSFGGDADGSCGKSVSLPDGTSGDACNDRSPPLGIIAALRGGYRFTAGLGVEVTLGYVRMSERLTRLAALAGDEAVFASSDYEDETKLGAPFGGVGVSYQFFEKTPLLVRLTGGVARAQVDTSVTATLKGDVPDPDDPASTLAVSEKVNVPEDSQSLWLPFVAPEVRFGYRVSSLLTLDFGIAAMLLFGPDSPREGGTFGDRKARQVALTPTSGVNPGVVSFPHENALGTFVALAPSLGARLDF